MKEKEARLKEIKKELRPMNLVSIVACVLMVVGAVLTITASILNKQSKGSNDALFYTGIGMMITVVLLHLSAVIVNRKLINEQYRLTKEIKAKK